MNMASMPGYPALAQEFRGLAINPASAAKNRSPATTFYQVFGGGFYMFAANVTRQRIRVGSGQDFTRGLESRLVQPLPRSDELLGIDRVQELLPRGLPSHAQPFRSNLQESLW